MDTTPKFSTHIVERLFCGIEIHYEQFVSKEGHQHHIVDVLINRMRRKFEKHPLLSVDFGDFILDSPDPRKGANRKGVGKALTAKL